MSASRYEDTGIATSTVPDGLGAARLVRYRRRRWLPDPDGIVSLALHTVTAHDRLDLLSEHYLQDPTAFWQIADANAALDPDALIVPRAEGAVLVIPTPGV